MKTKIQVKKNSFNPYFVSISHKRAERTPEGGRGPGGAGMGIVSNNCAKVFPCLSIWREDNPPPSNIWLVLEKEMTKKG